MPKNLKSSKTALKVSKPAAKKQKGKKDEADLSMACVGHPEIFPLHLTAKTQEIFSCQPDEDVTEEIFFKCIKKEDIIQDLKTRAKSSDFHLLKKVILEYPGEELLVVFDPSFQYGENFYIVASEEAKENFLKSLAAAEEKEETEEENIEETPEVHKPWVSLGSEKEVEEESVKERDTKIKYKISRVRRKFGAPITFTDRNAADEKDSYAECTAYEDDTFSIKMLERDVGVQMVPKLRETSTQTKWTYPKNASTQYYPRQLSNEAKAESLSSETLKNFLTAVHLRVEIALQQNEIMNVFFDDWKALADDQEEGKPDVYLKEYQSFTDVQYLKNRTISCVCWHPTIYGIIALSAREQPLYEEQVNLSNKSLLHQSVILFWSLFDPLCLQLVLKAPEDICCFQFSPSDPNIIAGGCADGQVVLWDISKHEEKLESTKPVADETTDSSEGEPRAAAAVVTEPLPKRVQQSSTEAPLVRHCAASSTPYCHTKPATDVQWLPCNIEENQKGGTSENKDEKKLQLVTCSPDCSILFWAIPSIERREQFLSEKMKEEKRSRMPHDNPNTDEDLDLSWKPLIKINLRERDNNTEYGPTRISLGKLQYRYKPPGRARSRSTLRAPKESPYTEMSAFSSKNLELLENISTDFFVGNEDGEVVYSEWKKKIDTNTAKPVSQKHSQKYALHTETINTLQKSPFFKDIFLSIGGQKFAIWKEGVTNISKSTITFISPSSASAEQHFLAVSDNLGVLHILEICQTLCHPSSNEHAKVLDYLEREVKYLKYCEEEFEEYQKFQAKTELKLNWRQRDRKHI
ncbi:dynein axonemal intermediate chain 3 isoform X3 [Passer domesticus]|uniref:dynein axonemal intermediate chain 3 isoform X3 n=1 Tax=Passer domesticus TaxID=48849 RepID=UPI0030FE397E